MQILNSFNMYSIKGKTQKFAKGISLSENKRQNSVSSTSLDKKSEGKCESALKASSEMKCKIKNSSMDINNFET